MSSKPIPVEFGANLAPAHSFLLDHLTEPPSIIPAKHTLGNVAALGGFFFHTCYAGSFQSDKYYCFIGKSARSLRVGVLELEAITTMHAHSRGSQIQSQPAKV
jgi:hypothetical protein